MVQLSILGPQGVGSPPQAGRGGGTGICSQSFVSVSAEVSGY